MTVILSDDERKAYFDLAGECLRQATAGKIPPDVLWHYTSGQSLIQIIQSGTLWATQISCLNDHREFRLASKLLYEAVDNYAATHSLTDDETFFWIEAKKALLEDAAPQNWWFVACFSARKNDLRQWRAYSGGEGGYSIGFHMKEIAALGAADQSYLAPVQYDEATHNAIAEKIAEASFRFFIQGLNSRPSEKREEWLNVFFREWSEAITYLAPIVKHKAFESEREWRLVRRLRPSDLPNMYYLQRQMMMSRHLPLPLANTLPSGRKLLPISEIMVGPSRHKEISRVSVADLLRTCEYPNLNVSISDVPFQTL